MGNSQGRCCLYKRNDPVLVLVSASSHQINFAFPSRQMALLIGTFAIAAALAILLHGAELRETSMLSYWFLCFLEIAFLWGTIFSFNMQCRLQIDQSQQKVYYFLSNLFRKQKWEKVFSDFQEIRIFCPGTDDGKAAMLKVLLKSKEGEEIPLGKSLFGIYRQKEARRLAKQIAEMMSLRVIEEPSIQNN